MSDIPYNYRKYIDDVTKMTQRGAISSGEQQASPSSAGSRGLAKTTQFTNNKTQMQLGQEAIAESMVDIRNIMNRIDGINVPTNEMNELADDEKMEFTKLLLDISVIKDRVQALSVDEDAKASAIQSLTNAEEALVALDETAVKEDDMRDMTISDLEAQLGKINDEITFLQIDQKDKESALAALGELRSVLDKYQSQKESTPEDSGELARLKELSGMEAPKESEEKVSEDIGDKGRIALEKAGFDPMKVKEYMAVFNDHGDTSEIDQMNMDKVGLADAMAMVLASHDVENESYQPMPEGDEFDIEEDEDFEEVLGPLGFPEDETELFDAEYQGRKVPLNKPMRGDSKKFKVYVKDPKTGNVKKVNFGHGGTSAKKAGQKTMKIRKSNPKARKSFRARHNCANPGPKTKARYWSCRKW